MIKIAADTVVDAQAGKGEALDEFVQAIQRPVYNLARRMLARHPDAEDATQEILVIAVTRLSQLRDPAAAGGWVLKLAMRHLIRTRKQSAVEAMRFTTTSFAEDVEKGLAETLGTAVVDADRAILAGEVKIGCTIALLTSLSRSLRAAYVLGEIYELADEQTARALGITPAAARQRLSRARTIIEGFTKRHCGMVSPAALCSCNGRVDRALELGRIGSHHDEKEARQQLPIQQIKKAISALEEGRRTTALMQSNPDFETSVAASLRTILQPAPLHRPGSRRTGVSRDWHRGRCA